MQSFTGDERRKTLRTHLTTFCPTTFKLGGDVYRALMVDISESGARFQYDQYVAQIDLNIGAVMQYEIKTPYGLSTCRGKVAWSRHIGDQYTWGIEFIDLSKDLRDPLVALMDSSF